MERGSRRTLFTGSALAGLLARLGGVDIDGAESKQVLSERLSRWLDWTDAISLAAALDARAAPAGDRPGASSAVHDAERDLTHVRTALAKPIGESPESAAGPARPAPHAPAPAAPIDPEAGVFGPWRRGYVARQQAMEASIGPLRGRLRARLAAASSPLARLAAVDAVMERVVGARERALLAAVPQRLERHFERLHEGHREALAGSPQAHGAPDAWLAVFRSDMQAVLLAELDIRLQPVEGLLEALRRSQAGCHE